MSNYCDGTSQIFLSLILGIVVLASYFFRSKVSKNNGSRGWAKIPGSLPIIGNLIPGGLDNFYQTLDDWASQHGAEKGVYEINLFGKRTLVVCNEEKLSLIESLRPFKVVREEMVRNAVKSVGADGLFSAEGDTWKRDRKLVSRSLNRKNVRDYVAFVKLIGERLVDKWEAKMAIDGFISINSDLMSMTLDMTSLVAFGKDIDSLRSDKSQIGDDIKYIFKKIMLRLMSPFSYWKLPIVGQYLDGGGWAIKRVRQTLHEIILEYEANNGGDNLMNTRSNTFLGKVFMESKKDNCSLGIDQLVGNMLTLFLAGSETTMNTLCICLYEIAIDNTGLQDELASESVAFSGLDNEVSLEGIYEKLPRTRSFMYEILRLKGPAPSLFLENTESFEMEGKIVPPRTSIIMLLQRASILKSKCLDKSAPGELTETPWSEFDARRWLVGTTEKDASKLSVSAPSFKSGYRAFGSGMRVCPGRGLSEVEVLVVLVSVLRKFEIGLQEGHPPVKMVTRFTQCPDVDICLALKSRRCYDQVG